MNHCEKVSGWQERERNWHGQYKLRLFSTLFLYMHTYMPSFRFCAYVVSAKVDFDLLLMCFFLLPFFMSCYFFFVKFRKENFFEGFWVKYVLLVGTLLFDYHNRLLTISNLSWCNNWYDWLDDLLTFNF